MPFDLKNTVIILKKIAACLLFFWLVEFVISSQFIGRMFAPIVDNYWYFVFAGLVPAAIGHYKGESFWLWWLIGAYTPILSTVYALTMDSNNSNERSESESENDKKDTDF